MIRRDKPGAVQYLFVQCGSILSVIARPLPGLAALVAPQPQPQNFVRT